MGVEGHTRPCLWLVRRKEWDLGGPRFLCPSGKDHVCRFIGCGRNEKFNYVVMQLQVCPWDLSTCLSPRELEGDWGVAWGREASVPDGMGRG